MLEFKRGERSRSEERSKRKCLGGLGGWGEFAEMRTEKVTANAHCPCGLRALHKHNETRLSVDLSDLRVG